MRKPLRILGWVMVMTAWVWLGAIPLFWLGSFLYEAMSKSPEGNLSGMLAVASLYYFLPWWPILFWGGKFLFKQGE
jgi:hypothetical protein